MPAESGTHHALATLPSSSRAGSLPDPTVDFTTFPCPMRLSAETGTPAALPGRISSGAETGTERGALDADFRSPSLRRYATRLRRNGYGLSRVAAFRSDAELGTGRGARLPWAPIPTFHPLSRWRRNGYGVWRSRMQLERGMRALAIAAVVVNAVQFCTSGHHLRTAARRSRYASLGAGIEPARRIGYAPLFPGVGVADSQNRVRAEMGTVTPRPHGAPTPSQNRVR